MHKNAYGSDAGRRKSRKVRLSTTHILTAEMDAGRKAIETVMALSYQASITDVPSEWAMVRIVDDMPSPNGVPFGDGVPVSFIVVDPNRAMAFPKGDLRYAFICDVATREDHRYEGHFRALMEATFTRLQGAGIPLVLTHGRFPLYRRFGFEVFTHHSGIFITPEQITQCLGMGDATKVETYLTIEDRSAIIDGMLLVTEVRAQTWDEYKRALRIAAAVAQERHKSHILFEYPPAPSYGSRYPLYKTLDTQFMTLAQECGAQVSVQNANPESGIIPDADWIKVLDMHAFLEAVMVCLDLPPSLPVVEIGFNTDVGAVTLNNTARSVQVRSGIAENTFTLDWPASAVAQLVTGYQSAKTLSMIYNTPLPDTVFALLNALFPKTWRLSRNESWTYKA